MIDPQSSRTHSIDDTSGHCLPSSIQGSASSVEVELDFMLLSTLHVQTQVHSASRMKRDQNLSAGLFTVSGRVELEGGSPDEVMLAYQSPIVACQVQSLGSCDRELECLFPGRIHPAESGVRLEESMTQRGVGHGHECVCCL